MSETQDDLTQFWAVGSSLTSKNDHAKFFIENNIWEDEAAKNGDPVNKEVLDTIKKGDYLLIRLLLKKIQARAELLRNLKPLAEWSEG